MIDVNNVRATFHFMQSHEGDAVDCVSCARRADAFVTLMALRQPEGRLQPDVRPHWIGDVANQLSDPLPGTPWHDVRDVVAALMAGADGTSNHLHATWQLLTQPGEPNLDLTHLGEDRRPAVHRGWHALHPRRAGGPDCAWRGHPWADL